MLDAIDRRWFFPINRFHRVAVDEPFLLRQAKALCKGRQMASLMVWPLSRRRPFTLCARALAR
jgi:hypothetical protein